MSFHNPTYLWALLGLAIPIAIHLWSKKEGRTIKIGSIRLLSEAESKQSSSINLNELLLLFIRLILLTILVFILADPQIKQDIQKTPITYIVEPSLLNNNTVGAFIDSIGSDVSIKLLRSGFPEFEDNESYPSNYSVPNYWQMAKEMEMLHTDSIVVFTNALLTGFKGMRPQIKKNIEWITFDPGEETSTLLKVVNKEDALQLISLKSSAQSLSFENNNISINNQNIVYNNSKDSIRLLAYGDQKWKAIKSEESLKILLFYEDTFINELTYLEAAFNAISKHINRPFEIEKVKDINNLDLNIHDAVLWLSSAPVAESTSKILSYKKDDHANSLIVPSTKKNLYHLTESLNSENIIDEHLPEQLLNFLELDQDLQLEIEKYDQRVMSGNELRPVVHEAGSEVSYPNVLSISKWLWILFAMVLIIERFVSDLRSQ